MKADASGTTRIRFPALNGGQVLAALLMAALSMLIGMLVVATPELAGRPRITDFDIFLIVGTMARAGEIAAAYHYPSLLEVQYGLTGSQDFMPWAYPPPFNLVVEAMASLPRGIAYGMFTGLTLLAWYSTVKALAGQQVGWVMLMMFPALLTLTFCGQNGYLTATIMGGFAALWLRGNRWSGALLGLMIIKPHMALGAGFLMLVRLEWRTLLVAGSVALALCAVSTLAYGVEIWTAFLNGTRDAGEFMRQGLYPLFRMTSLYAPLHTLGLAPGLAMAVQLATAAAGSAAIFFASRSPSVPPRHMMALACAGGLMFSPYAYDYDLPILGIALALVARDLLARARPMEKLGLAVAAWIAGGSGFMFTIMAMSLPAEQREAALMSQPSPAGFALILLLLWCARILTRGQARQPAAAMPAGAQA